MEINSNHVKFIALVLAALIAEFLINYNGVLDSYHNLTGKVVKEIVETSSGDAVKLSAQQKCEKEAPEKCVFYRVERTDKKRYSVSQYGSYTCYYGCPKEDQSPKQKKKIYFENQP